MAIVIALPVPLGGKSYKQPYMPLIVHGISIPATVLYSTTLAELLQLWEPGVPKVHLVL